MSKNITKVLDPLGLFRDKNAGAPSAGTPPAPAPAAPKDNSMALREELLGQQARAGAATLSENEADRLGFSAISPKKRNASRALLG